MRVALLLLLAACGASSAPGPTKSEPAASCPATFAAITPSGACPDAVGAECNYPEGGCHCGPQSYCGGVAPSDEMLAELEAPVWQCEAARTDGCPETPTGSCDEAGKQCVYGDCCVQIATCTDGAWVAGQMSCPP